MISKFTKQLKGAAILGALLMGSNAFAQLGLSWSEMGPNDAAGRCRVILVDKTDGTGNRMFAAGASGGIFKSTNAGANWTPINDKAASLIVSCMDQDQSGTIYFGTGESFGRSTLVTGSTSSGTGGPFGSGMSAFMGRGLYKLDPTNSTYTLLKDSSVFGNVNEIAVTGSTLYVAADKGFFISTDAGTTFNEEAMSVASGKAAMDVKLTKSLDVFYSAGVKTASTSAVYFSAAGSGVYSAVTPTMIANRGRIEIATSPVDPNYVYLSIAKMKSTASSTATPATGGLSAVMGSNDKGATWTTITLGTSQFDPMTTFSGKGIGDYANTIIADPIKKDAFALASDVFYIWSQISSNSFGQGIWSQLGTNFSPFSPAYIGPNVHDVKFNGGNNCMYIATDAGIYKSVSNNSAFLPYNKGFNIGQYNSVSAPNFPRISTTSNNTVATTAGVVGGSMSNGVSYLPGNLNNDPMVSKQLGNGDVYQTDFSKIIPKALFYAGPSGSIFRTTDVDAAATPATFYDVNYKAAALGSPGGVVFANEFTPFRLWENLNYGDSAIFFNGSDTTSFVNASATKTTFTDINSRSQLSAKYDNIVISCTSAATASQAIVITPVYTGTNITSLNVTGDTPGASSNTVYVNSSLIDSVRYTFTTAPGTATIQVIFNYIYVPGDVITYKSTDISGSVFTESVTLTKTLTASNPTVPLQVVKIPLRKSGRLAAGVSTHTTAANTSPMVYVVKRALNFSLNPDWIKVAGKNSRVETGGISTTSDPQMPVLGKSVTRLEWSPDGSCIYFSTRLNDTTYYLYRTSHLQWIGDLAAADYSGAFSTDIDTIGGGIRKNALERTTPIGMFKNPITGLAITNDNMNLMVMCGGYKNTSGTVYYSNADIRTMNTNTVDATNFTVKNGSTLPMFPAYTGIFEMSDNKRVLVGTESGIYSTTDITAGTPAWTAENGTANNFPNVPVMQIRQQTLPPWLCYNSGSIYVATHGRGIWSTDKFLSPYAIGINELNPFTDVTSGMKVFPNPTSDATNLVFKSTTEASYKVSVYDINGRLMASENTGKLADGQIVIGVNTSSLPSGMYFVTVAGSNNFTANSKLVVTH